MKPRVYVLRFHFKQTVFLNVKVTSIVYTKLVNYNQMNQLF